MQETSLSWVWSKLQDLEPNAARSNYFHLFSQFFSQEKIQAEAAAADRAARMSSSNAALAASAESEAAREWKRQAAEARRAEAKAMASQQRAEVAAQNARKEIGQKRPKLQVEPVEPVEPEKREGEMNSKKMGESFNFN